MLIAMNEQPNQLENVKLANNAGYLGEMGAVAVLQPFRNWSYKDAASPDTGRYIYPDPYHPPVGAQDVTPPKKDAPQTDRQPSVAEQMTAAFQAATAQIPAWKQAFAKPPREKSEKKSEKKTDTLTYVLIGGGVLLGGMLLYSMFKKKGKR